MHTGWKSRGWGSSDFCQNPGGVGPRDKAFWKKLPGGPLFWVLLHFNLHFYLFGGLMFTLPPSPRCVHLCIQCKFGKIWYSCNWPQTCQISKGPQNWNMTLASVNSLEYLSEFGEYCALRSYPFNSGNKYACNYSWPGKWP